MDRGALMDHGMQERKVDTQESTRRKFPKTRWLSRGYPLAAPRWTTMRSRPTTTANEATYRTDRDSLLDSWMKRAAEWDLQKGPWILRSR